MSKKLLIILASALGAVGLSVGGFILYQKLATPGTPVYEDEYWYNEGKNEFVLTTPEEMYQFLNLSYRHDFADKTVRLGADITFNEGDAADWKENPPAKQFFAIQHFAGTFDGQGHTISGIYQSGYDVANGLFCNTKATAVIKNFRLVNSFFEDGAGTVCSIAETSCGTFSQIYSDALVFSGALCAGGLFTSPSGRIIISDCQFDGYVYAEDQYVGGILDTIVGQRATISHCLFSGILSSNSNYNDSTTAAVNAGGICGTSRSAGHVIIEDCLSVGKFVFPEYTNDLRSGSIYGGGMDSGTAAITHSYGSDAAFRFAISDAKGTVLGAPIRYPDTKLRGEEAYRWTQLDFNEHWAAIKDGYPGLKCFTKDPMDITSVKRIWNTDWYTEEATVYHLKTVEDLYGFSFLSYDGINYEGKIIYLDNDLVVNEGDCKEWSDTVAPALDWSPVQDFAGTFDGQNHSISGIYVCDEWTLGFFAKTQATATVQNFRLLNSLIYTKGQAGTLYGMSGTIAGRGGGSFMNIYSNSRVVGEGYELGGIIGQINLRAITTFMNVWFDGEVNSYSEDKLYTGGFIGMCALGTTQISQCLMTGTVRNNVKGLGAKIGGIVGTTANDAKLTIAGSLITGTIDSPNLAYRGSAIGFVSKGTNAVIRDTYALQGCTYNEFGATYSHNVNNTSTTFEGCATPLFREELTGMNAYVWTNLNFNKYWTVRPGDTPVLTSFTDVKNPSFEGIAKGFDDSWYDKDADVLYINNTKQFISFSRMSYGNYFLGKTIRLNADIVLNNGDATTWASSRPAYQWKPIGKFMGTFDGQGHTISGVYSVNMGAIGLFEMTTIDATLKNFRLTNSYFKSTKTAKNYAMSGSVIGRGGGRLSNIYSNAIIETYGIETGGIIGQANLLGDTYISNCWFDGKIIGRTEDAKQIGGFVGTIAQGAIHIDHSLFTGSLSNEVTLLGALQGGFVGSVTNNTTVQLTMNDCLSDGTCVSESKGYDGSVLGVVYEKATARLTNVYTTAEGYLRKGTSVATNISSASQTNGIEPLKGTATIFPKERLTGVNGYRWTLLDFNSYWAAMSDSAPRLRAFTGNGIDLTGVSKAFDTAWYDPAETTYTITTPEQMNGISILSSSENFEGKTILLGNDIVYNTGNASDYALTPPENAWVPIMNFKGTFDGQDHTLSGFYTKAGGDNVGLFGVAEKSAVIKNFRLTNSYFYSSGNFLGSVVGKLSEATMDTVYSDSIVESGIDNATGDIGGLIGAMSGSANTLLKNSWFKGKVYSETNANYIGGLVGATTAGKKGPVHTIENCLFTGTVDCKATGGTAGILGYAMNADTVISHSLSAGNVTTSAGNVGAICGRIGSGYILTVTDSYGASDLTKNGIAVALKQGTLIGNPMVFASSNLTGINGYRMTSLDFSAGAPWIAVANGMPELRAFSAKTPLNVTGVTRADFSWYDAAQTEFTLMSANELLGFAILSKSDSFSGKTIKLGADIDMNPGWTLGNGKPDLLWPIIASSDRSFLGTFDGQNHTVSGIYVESSAPSSGFISFAGPNSLVQNLRITNSYMEGSASRLGSVIGTLGGGRLQNVYSDAKVVSTGTTNATADIGGLVGGISTNVSSIKNAWFTGTVEALSAAVPGNGGANRVGGILGAVASPSGSGYVSTLENCLFTGTVNCQATGGTGGIVGTLHTGSANITNCLSNGSVQTTAAGNVGSVLGYVYAGYTITFVNAYGTSDLVKGGKGLGNSATGSTVVGAPEVYTESGLIGAKGYQWTLLDFKEEPFWIAIEGKTPELHYWSTETPMDITGLLRVDTSWYDAAATTYTISTPEQLLGFASLSQTNKFAGKTIKLGADINLNGTWTAGSTEPLNVWPMVGANFAGTFDGQNHTISGVYVNNTASDYTGFFKSIAATAVVKNFSLKNSYFTSTKNCLGSIVGGNLGGTIETVYSEATIYTELTVGGSLYGIIGGIAGQIHNASTAGTIRECWYAGTLTSVNTANYIGGIVGRAMSGPADSHVIEHCLYTGTISCNAANGLGGIIGYSQSSNVNITDCLVTGNAVTTTGGPTGGYVGGIAGCINSGYKLNLSSCYAVTKNIKRATEYDCNILVGQTKGTLTQDSSSVVTKENITGSNALDNLQLEFSGKPYWIAVNDTTPELKQFSEKTAISTEGYVFISTSWYDATKTTYTLTSAGEFLGFANLSKTNTFAGKTIELGADITVNTALATSYQTTPPKYVFAMIGDGTTKKFAGTFDGKGHTISGIYVSSTKPYSGLFMTTDTTAVVKNFRLTNSYFTINANNFFGSIVGATYGSTIENVYSDAILRTSAVASATNTQFVGGIVGGARGTKGSTIRSCEFAGDLSILTGNFHGGIMGYTIDGTTSTTTTISNCLFTGKVASAGTGGVGGIIGRHNGGKLTIEKSLAIGSVTTTAAGNIGAVAGYNNAGTLTIANSVYGVTDDITASNPANSHKLFGVTKSGQTTANNAVTVTKTSITGDDAITTLTGLDFTTIWATKTGAYPYLRALINEE